MAHDGTWHDAPIQYIPDGQQGFSSNEIFLGDAPAVVLRTIDEAAFAEEKEKKGVYWGSVPYPAFEGPYDPNTEEGAGYGKKIIYSKDEASTKFLSLFDNKAAVNDMATDLWKLGLGDARVRSMPNYFEAAGMNAVVAYNASETKGDLSLTEWIGLRASESKRGEPPWNPDGSPKESGAYTGPVRTIDSTVMDDRDVEITLNDFATDMLGRNLTNKELKKYSSKFKKQDALPQVSLRTPNGPGQVTSVTQERQSRNSIVQDILQENPDYAKNVINTDVLDMFKRRLGI